MRIFQAWNGTSWVETPIEKLPLDSAGYIRCVERKDITLKGMKIHMCNSIPTDKPYFINPLMFKHCPHCGEELQK